MFVSVETPWRGLGAGEKAQAYLRACIRDALARDELPWASHAMLAWTRALYDEDPDQREEGLKVHKEVIRTKVDKIVFYVDHGMSSGMRNARTWAIMQGKPFEERRIYENRNQRSDW
jgi:hypothetical protein